MVYLLTKHFILSVVILSFAGILVYISEMLAIDALLDLKYISSPLLYLETTLVSLAVLCFHFCGLATIAEWKHSGIVGWLEWVFLVGFELIYTWLYNGVFLSCAARLCSYLWGRVKKYL